MYSTKLISLRISLRLLQQLDSAIRKARREDSSHKYTRNGVIIKALEKYLGVEVSKK